MIDFFVINGYNKVREVTFTEVFAAFYYTLKTNAITFLGGGNMATSTFGKKFVVNPEKTKDFMKEMTRTVTPTLPKDFHSNLSNLTREKELREDILKVLSK